MRRLLPVSPRPWSLEDMTAAFGGAAGDAPLAPIRAALAEIADRAQAESRNAAHETLTSNRMFALGAAHAFRMAARLLAEALATDTGQG